MTYLFKLFALFALLKKILIYNENQICIFFTIFEIQDFFLYFLHFSLTCKLCFNIQLDNYFVKQSILFINQNSFSARFKFINRIEVINLPI